MVSDFETLATRIATAIATTGLRLPTDGAPPDNINPPTALLMPTGEDGLPLDESSTTVTWELLVALQDGGSFHATMAQLHAYLSRTGAKSIRAALRAGLGGDLLGVRLRQTGRFEVNGAMVVGARYELEVISQ